LSEKRRILQPSWNNSGEKIQRICNQKETQQRN